MKDDIASLMFRLEELDRGAATRLTMAAINVAEWPYSQCGLGFGDPDTWTPRMKRHAPVLRRGIIQALKDVPEKDKAREDMDRHCCAG